MSEFVRTAIVTGANSGIGYETTKALARQDIKVIMACRNIEKAEKAKTQILKEVSKANLRIIQLDLNSFDSIRNFAKEYKSKYQALDILINNAGFMANKFQVSEDGFESQFATNFLGHYLLSGLLLDLLKNAEDARIVSLASIAHRFGNFNKEKINNPKSYQSFMAYSNSKLACLMYSYELNKRIKTNNKTIKSVAAHPGISRTNISHKLPQTLLTLQSYFGGLVFSDMARGAESIIHAALDLSVKGGDYFGPSGLFEVKGKPKKVDSNKKSKNEQLAREIWQYAEEATGFLYEF